MEGDYIKIRHWLLPISWIYGIGVRIRNKLFDFGVLKSKSYQVPIISVGNITVGGSGKTPHVEYLVSLLKDQFQVATLSRGYKRKSKGFQLADKNTKVSDIGDEPFQIWKKFPKIFVAVDNDRCHGIETLIADEDTKDTEVVILDDAFQHRYVKPGVNILLVDYHRLIIYDKLLPAGRMREPKSGKNRADIVIITKCPKDLKPMDYRVLQKAMNLYPYQKLYFTSIEYCDLKPLYCGEDLPLEKITKETNILLITGIASPQQITDDISKYSDKITPLTYSDHYQFKQKDLEKINAIFASLPSPKIIITTEKDAARMIGMQGLNDDVRKSLYTLPLRVSFLLEQEEMFNNNIINYVRKNSRNSILAQGKDDNKTGNSDSAGNGAGTISFRNN